MCFSLVTSNYNRFELGNKDDMYTYEMRYAFLIVIFVCLMMLPYIVANKVEYRVTRRFAECQISVCQFAEQQHQLPLFL